MWFAWKGPPLFAVPLEPVLAIVEHKSMMIARKEHQLPTISEHLILKPILYGYQKNQAKSLETAWRTTLARTRCH